MLLHLIKINLSSYVIKYEKQKPWRHVGLLTGEGREKQRVTSRSLSSCALVGAHLSALYFLYLPQQSRPLIESAGYESQLCSLCLTLAAQLRCPPSGCLSVLVRNSANQYQAICRIISSSQEPDSQSSSQKGVSSLSK